MVLQAIASIRKEKVTVTGGVPFILLEVLDALKGSDDHFLETLSFGGAAPPLRLTDDVQATKKGMVMLTQAYGTFSPLHLSSARRPLIR